MALLRKETSTMVHGAEWQRPIGCLIFIGHLPAPVNHVKIFKGWPLRDAPSELVQLWYKKHFHPTMIVWWKWKTQLDWVMKPVPHDLVRRIRFWRIESQEQDFKDLYWMISKMLFWNLFSSKGTYMIDLVGRSPQKSH